MSFWQSLSDLAIDGSEENSHVKTFSLLPNGTTAMVTVKKAELVNSQFDGNQTYEITYEIKDGEFKESLVKHKIHCFDPDPRKRDRSVNMLMRLFKLISFNPGHTSQPSNDDLAKLPKNSKIGIKVREWQKDGKEGNWVSEIHPIDEKWTTKTGTKLQNSANFYSKNDSSNLFGDTATASGDDIPF